MSQFSKRQTTLIFALITAVVIGIALALVLITFRRVYRDDTQINPPPPRELSAPIQEFAVKTIRIRDLDTDCTLEIKNNGQATQFCGQTQIKTNQKIFSLEEISSLFTNLDESTFNNLLNDYFSSNRNLQITIETNKGTKTISINSSSSNQLDDNISDIIDEIEEIEEEVISPTPPPPPTPSPTPTSTPGSTPTPFPSSTPSPTPQPTIYQPTRGPQDSFNCNNISETDVTVSNTRCLP